MVILANIISLIAAAIMIAIGIIKDKKAIILWQSIQIFLNIITNAILGSATGVINNIAGCTRNLLCYKNKLTKPVQITLVTVMCSMSLILNNKGWIGLLPALSSFVYTLRINEPNPVKLKQIIIFTAICWAIHDFYIQAYTSCIFNIVCLIMNFIGIIHIKKGASHNAQTTKSPCSN